MSRDFQFESTDDVYASMSEGAYEEMCQQAGANEGNYHQLEGWYRNSNGDLIPAWREGYDPAEDSETTDES